MESQIGFPNLLYVPTLSTTPITWVQNSYAEVSNTAGTFSLTNAITGNDRIQVDYDYPLI